MKAIINQKTEIELVKSKNTVLLAGKEVLFDLRPMGNNSYHLLLNQCSYRVELVSKNTLAKEFHILINGKPAQVKLQDKLDELLQAMGMLNDNESKLNDLKAPMPGLVVDIPITVGQDVKKGDVLIILEAMKMENALKASADARVLSVQVKKGEAVEKNTVLIRFES